MRRAGLISLALATAVLAAACTKLNPAYCADSKQCLQGEECKMDSPGKNTCVEIPPPDAGDPTDAPGSDGATDGGP